MQGGARLKPKLSAAAMVWLAITADSWDSVWKAGFFWRGFIG